ncbi:CubicO group peptidase, beta-lactamase class C family [Lentzea xinjiangensis]|uniref:CubicO group peptidase, beta-lactamase class C family n=1 Tax=Lentzea xinjiangensis TaxID=402600 RepID=A0A1H9WGU5_9PSEU|nr:serine hydrolase domain-containing protein [Lentzea xinjiangensis]SES33120.1 CubicO group peptidase, beta-lactamase class C family [Lentzea xinjiangensis]
MEHLPAAAPGATGAAVAVRQGGRELVLVGGTTGRHDPRPVTGRTRFELGSLTKAFTGLLLAEMADRAEVDLHDPVRHHLPPGAAPRLGRGVTLASLATHTSGLPRLPPGLWRAALPHWRTNPYRDFGAGDFAAALRRTRPEPPGRYRYSNFGVALLGQALANAADLPYERLLADRVLRPIGLPDTGFSASGQVTGHLRGRPLPPWEVPGLPAAGGLRSSASDLLRYLTAHLSPPSTSPLGRACREVARPRAQAGDHEVGLVWNLRCRSGRELLFHSGGTRGCTAFAAFSPSTATALLALVNAGPTVGSRFVQRSYEAAWALVERAGTARPAEAVTTVIPSSPPRTR